MPYLEEEQNGSLPPDWSVIGPRHEQRKAIVVKGTGKPPLGRQIIIAKKGADRLLIKLSDIAYFFTKDKLIFAVDREGKKFLIDHTLSNLEETLNPDTFFRINRQAIVSIHYIKRFRTFEKNRIEMELDLPAPLTLQCSQSATIGFRKWVYHY